LLRHPFFAKPPPKSLDRNEFRGWVGTAFDSGSVEDGAATLTALTATAAARIVPLLPRVPKTWIVSGGGARNPTLMRMLAERLAPARVQTADDAGLPFVPRSSHCIAPGPGTAPGGHLPRMIIPSTSSLLTSATRAVPTTRPFFITQILSERSNTS
jgi:hypothetical protein